MDPKKNSFQKMERKLIEWIMRLVRSDFKWLGRILLMGLRFSWRHRPSPTEGSLKVTSSLPTGPYATKRKQEMGDLLIWVPLKIDSFIIDDVTGGFGYSHVTVDTGEVDLPTGKPVMVEITIKQVVERKFQDEYSGRPYARIPLSKTGMDVDVFVAKVKSRMGEQYDYIDALTLGEIHDPAKEMCSSLASDCLPEAVQREIAKARRLGLLRLTSVSVHSPSKAPKVKVFISPNGFAQYYGAPEGKKLHSPDFWVEPRPVDTTVKGVMLKHAWKVVLILGVAGTLIAGALSLISK